MIRIWIGAILNDWRMWGITIKTKQRWWFIGVSREYKEPK